MCTVCGDVCQICGMDSLESEVVRSGYMIGLLIVCDTRGAWVCNSVIGVIPLHCLSDRDTQDLSQGPRSPCALSRTDTGTTYHPGSLTSLSSISNGIKIQIQIQIPWLPNILSIKFKWNSIATQLSFPQPQPKFLSLLEMCKFLQKKPS